MVKLTGPMFWQVFLDFCIMAVLLLFGEIVRAKIKVFQKLLIPAALIAGFTALALGPKGYGILPLSASFGTYAAIFIVIIFAATPIGDTPSKEAMSSKVIGGMFFNLTGIAVLQYAVGMFVTIYCLKYFYPDLPDAFGLMMATGFYGGHGTAAAVGKTFQDLGIASMTDLGYTCATVGIVGGIILGIVVINWGTRSGYTHYVKDPQQLPVELRTGLIPPERQKGAGRVTVSSICIDPMAFHLGIVLAAALGGYYISKWFLAFSKGFYAKGIAVPEFCTALLVGFAINKLLNSTGAQQYVDRYTVSRIQGTAADLLMVSGIGSLNLKTVMTFAVPLIVVCLLGFVTVWWWFLVVGGKSSFDDWFERNMMVWGHATGVAATGVLLQRVVDPDLKSRGIEDSGIADLFNRPIIIGLQVIPPILMSVMPAIGGHVTTWVCFAIVAIMWIVAYKLEWWVPSMKLKKYSDDEK